VIPSTQMKHSSSLLFLAFITISFTAPVPAQLVHLSFVAEEGTGSHTIRGDRQLFYPWDTAGRGALTASLHFDLYYDLHATQTGSEDWGAAYYGQLDPERNFFRMQYQGYRMDQPFDVTRAITSFAVFEKEMSFIQNLNANWPYPDFEFSMSFQSSPSLDFAIPQPPFPPFDPLGLPHLFLEGGRSLFDLEGLGEASFSVRFTDLRYEIIPDVTPVPEPGTYGLAAALVLGAALGVRRWKTIRTFRTECAGSTLH